MTASGSNGGVAFGPQADKDTIATDFYAVKVIGTDLGVLDDVRPNPPEVGGLGVLTGAFKAGLLYGGTISMVPRLEDSLGWLLYAMIGDYCFVESYGGESGVNAHVFTVDVENTTNWLTFMKLIPGQTGVEKMLEIGKGCKVTTAQFAFPQADLINLQLTVAGITPSVEKDPDITATGYDWAAAEDFSSSPISVDGSFHIGSTAIKALGATVTFGNMMTGPREERIYGSPYLDDIQAMFRSMSIRFVHKWNDADLYQQCFANDPDGTDWSREVFTDSVRLVTRSPGNIDSKNQPYQLIFEADKVTFAPEAPVGLAAARPISQSYVGTVVEDDTNGFARIILINDTAEYSWPT